MGHSEHCMHEPRVCERCREIEPNIEPVEIPDALLDRVLDAAGRPSVGRSDSARAYAQKYAEQLRQPSIAPATVTAAYRQVGGRLEVSRPDLTPPDNAMIERFVEPVTPRDADCQQCGMAFFPLGVDDKCTKCGGTDWIYRY